MGTSSSLYNFGVSGDTVVWHRTSDREVWVSKSNSAVCVLEQDTLLPESTGKAQEAVAPSQHD